MNVADILNNKKKDLSTTITSKGTGKQLPVYFLMIPVI
jgi:hypothetical protein